jgi:hypothetical protein
MTEQERTKEMYLILLERKGLFSDILAFTERSDALEVERKLKNHFGPKRVHMYHAWPDQLPLWVGAHESEALFTAKFATSDKVEKVKPEDVEEVTS